jgi:hypothetical protein
VPANRTRDLRICSQGLSPLDHRGGPLQCKGSKKRKPLDCETSKIQQCLENRLIDGGEVVSLTSRLRSTPQKNYFLFLVLISVRDWVNHRVIVRQEGLGKLKRFKDFIGSRTRDLPAWSIVPQTTTPPRTIRTISCRVPEKSGPNANLILCLRYTPLLVAAQSKAWTFFAPLNSRVVGSNPTRCMNACVHWCCLCCPVRSFAMGWFPVQSVQPIVYA